MNTGTRKKIYYWSKNMINSRFFLQKTVMLVWNRQELSELLVQRYLDNTLPGVYFAEIADVLTIHVYLTRRARRRKNIL